MRKRRGQFFIIASLVIVAILIGFATIYNLSKAPKEDFKVYDLSEEINYETNQVIDNGIFTGASQEQIAGNIENVTLFYAKSNPESDFIFYYGNKTVINYIIYIRNESGKIGLDFGTGVSTAQAGYTREVVKGTEIPSGNIVRVVVDEEIFYDFDLKEGQNFYLIIKKQRGQEKFVAVE